MTAFATIRRKRYSTTVFSLAVFSWLGLLAVPCAAALMPDEPSAPAKHAAAEHTYCADAKPAELMPASECCCDQNVVVGLNVQDVAQPSMLLVMPNESESGLSLSSASLEIYFRKTPLHETSLPIYLATQRLRI